MSKIAPVATFRTGFAGSRYAVCLSAAMDAFDPTEPYTRTVILNERHSNLWTFSEHDFIVRSVCAWRDPAPPGLRFFAALGEDGEVVILAPQAIREQIPDAGLPRDGFIGYGYLSRIRQIGTRLYACGYMGQVYRREGPDHWVHMDEGVLQDPPVTRGAYFIQAMDGPGEDDLYIAGSIDDRGHPPRADHWDGRAWTRIELPSTAGRITAIHVESPARIWMCGAQGTLLLGNAADGFRTMNAFGDTKLFLSLTVYGGVVYLGGVQGLFQFDPATPRGPFRKVRTGLTPELVDANVVQSVDGVLWSLGPKDVARFDGQAWQRFQHPDNPPIARVDPRGSGSDA